MQHVMPVVTDYSTRKQVSHTARSCASTANLNAVTRSDRTLVSYLAWKGLPVLITQVSYPLIVSLRERRARRFAHACDHRDCRALQPTPSQFLGGIVLEQAEQAELLTSGPGQPYLVSSTHGAVHSLPLAAT